MNATMFSRVRPTNFVTHLQTLAEQRPHDTALIVVRTEDDEVVDTPITYSALDQRVRALAAQLQQRFEKCDRALLLLENDDHYVVSLFACFYAGVIAVPVFPPESSRPQHVARLLGIARDADARCVLTSSAILSLLGDAAQLTGATAIAVDQVDIQGASNWKRYSPRLEEVAFLQYTSGSTSAPKGVMVTHGNLMANEQAIEEGLSVTADDVFISWLPLFHDMGLIGGLLQPLYQGIPVGLMKPQFFLERPIRWLEAISRLRGTISGGPDFAYRLCVERVKQAQLQELDLSSWRLAFSGAEPVRHDTLQNFVEHFSPAGFDASAVYPCYGLAEATLFVSGGRRGSGMVANVFATDGLARGVALAAEQGNRLVACGGIASGHEVRIVDPATETSLEDSRIGEIWVSGPSVAQGYWGNRKATEESFVQRQERTWLRTGDLGFRCNGQLYIAGRVKDLIIVRGHNLYPQDIERAIEAEVDAVRRGRVAAFSVTGPDGEGIGVAVEVSRSMQKVIDPSKLVEALGAAVAESCGQSLSMAALLHPGALPKTSSGKLQRSACRRGCDDGSLDAYALYKQGEFVLGGTAKPEPEPLQDDIEITLAAIWRKVLRRDEAETIANDAHFFTSGGNSLLAVQTAARIAEHWNIVFPVRLLFESPRLKECAAEIRKQIGTGEYRERTVIPALPQERRRSALPLSHAQLRQWLVWSMHPDSSAYHVSAALRMQGRLDIEPLQQAVEGVVRRHDILRTVFQVNDGQPEQLIQDDSTIASQLIDLRGRSAEERAACLPQILREIHDRPFDLTQGPLLRIALIRLQEEEQLLVAVMHHIISDGASMQILLDELTERTIACCNGKVATLPLLEIQYADYASWQRDWLAAGESKRQLSYWREQLGNEHPVLALPVDHPRQAVASYKAAQHVVELPQPLLASLHRLAETQGASLFMVLLAGFQVLLHRHTGQEDIRVGVPVANRSLKETEKLIGFFVNTLVLRNVMNGRMPLGQILRQAKEAALGAQENQDLPFEQLVEALRPERSTSHHPLFQVMFNFLQEDTRTLQQWPGVRSEIEVLEAGAAQFELTLEIRQRIDGPTYARWVYASELFDAPTISRLERHFLQILQTMVECPELPAGDCSILSSAERAGLLAWSRNDRRYANLEPLHRSFERRVMENEDAVALLFEDIELSYGELNRRANRLAHRLMALGVKPEAVVGVSMERSIDMVIALLAILKAGGAYLPLDPDYPSERLAGMLEDSGAAIVLTQMGLDAHIPGEGHVITLEVDALDLSSESDRNPEVLLHGDHPAYVIYTSGSTGKPKGVANRHSSIANRIAWMQEAYALTSVDTVLQKTPFSFDVSVWEFFWPLITGARLAIAAPHDHRNPQRLVEVIRQHAVTTLHFVPSMLQAFMEHEDVGLCSSLRRVVCSGEALPADLPDKGFEHLPSVALYNLYGPTEAAVDVTHWTCDRQADVLFAVPIGQPISDIETYILDGELGLVAPGVAGELYLGGKGLARGYRNRPALTAERFVANPFNENGERIYRTGDLAKWRQDGQIEYLGRIDHQVKVRGFRIELGEIEARLLALPEVREAVAVAQAGPAGTVLSAYVTASRQGEADPVGLKQQLGKVLPDYMVPSAIAVLDSLPLNANGKLDRKALPRIDVAGHAAYAPPQGRVAETVASVWAEVLGREKVGMNDHFFDLGGHSLQVIRVHQLLERKLNAGIPLLDLFKYPTVASLSTRIEQGSEPSAAIPEDEMRGTRQRSALSRRRRSAERVS